MKTVCVLLGGWAFLGDHITSKQLLGMAIAVAGMVLYGFATCVPRALCSHCLPSCGMHVSSVWLDAVIE